MERKLVRICEHKEAWAAVHSLGGTGRHVLELVMFGHAYASRYILLKSALTLDRLKNNDVKTLALIRSGGSGLGRVIKASQLRYDTEDGCMYVEVGD